MSAADRLLAGLAAAAAHGYAWSLVLERAYPADATQPGEADARAALAGYWSERERFEPEPAEVAA